MKREEVIILAAKSREQNQYEFMADDEMISFVVRDWHVVKWSNRNFQYMLLTKTKYIPT